MLAVVAACCHNADIHRRRHQHRLICRKQQRGSQVVCEPGRHLRQYVSRGRCNDNQVGAARQLDVAHLAFIGQRKEIDIDLAFAQRLQRKRCDEMPTVRRQHAGDRAALTTQQSDQLQRLVRGDATRNDQQTRLP